MQQANITKMLKSLHLHRKDYRTRLRQEVTKFTNLLQLSGTTAIKITPTPLTATPEYQLACTQFFSTSFTVNPSVTALWLEYVSPYFVPTVTKQGYTFTTEHLILEVWLTPPRKDSLQGVKFSVTPVPQVTTLNAVLVPYAKLPLTREYTDLNNPYFKDAYYLRLTAEEVWKDAQFAPYRVYQSISPVTLPYEIAGKHQVWYANDEYILVFDDSLRNPRYPITYAQALAVWTR